jgi:hypothetical protein
MVNSCLIGIIQLNRDIRRIEKSSMYKLEVIVQQNTTDLNLPTRVKLQHRISQNELRVVWSVFTEHGSYYPESGVK